MAYTGDRSTISQTVKLADEATKGTAPTTGYVQLSSMGWAFTIDPTIQNFRPAGQKYTTVTALNREVTTMSLDGIPTYTEIIYPLSSVLTEAEYTAAAGTTSAAAGSRVMGASGNHWFFMPSNRYADNPLSYTIYKGNVSYSEVSSYVQVTDFNLLINRADTSLGGSAMGQALTTGGTMIGNELQTLSVNATAVTYTLTYAGQTTAAIAFDATEDDVLAALELLSTIPVGALRVEQTVDAAPQRTYTIQFGGSLGETAVADITVTDSTTGGTGVTVVETTAGAAISTVSLQPILPTEVCVYAFTAAQTDINDATNEVAANQLTELMEVEWTVGSRYTPKWVIDCTSSSYAAMVESEPTMQLRLRQQANEEGMTSLTNMRAGSTRFFRIRCTGIALGTDNYELTIDFAGQVVEASELSDEDGVYAVEWTFDGVPELANEGPVEISVVNNLTSI
jgi:hypothetical protein